MLRVSQYWDDKVEETFHPSLGGYPKRPRTARCRARKLLSARMLVPWEDSVIVASKAQNWMAVV